MMTIKNDAIDVIIMVDHLMAALLWCLSSRGASPWACASLEKVVCYNVRCDMTIIKQMAQKRLMNTFYKLEFTVHVIE